MHMNNKKSASPKLRFAEFANRGEVIFENGDALFEDCVVYSKKYYMEKNQTAEQKGEF